MSQQIIDSVMGHMKALLQEMTDTANAYEAHWRKLSQEIQESNGFGHQMWEDTPEEERAKAAKQRKADEAWDEAQSIRRCREAVARHVNAIIGENIEIQFSKWNM